MAANPKGFHLGDYMVFAAVLVISLGIGLYHAFTGGKQRTTKEFLVANRELRTIPVALSILVSFVSAILVLGTPAEMYTKGTLLLTRIVGYCFACIFSSLLFVPLFFPLKITSTFEYLDRRFKSKLVRRMGTVMMLLGNVFYMGLVMYAPSTALETVTGLPFMASVLACGFVAAVYTSLGGMKAVIWTDVFQALVMMGGLLAIVVRGSILVGGIDKVWSISENGGRLKWVDFSPDPTQRLSTWSLVIGGMFSTLIIYGIGQTSVQRFCSVPTLAQAKKTVYLNIPGLLILNILAALAGLVIYAYYSQIGCDPFKGSISNPNQLVPFFIMDVMNFPGFPGLFLAVLFSGALSSLSSSLNAASAVTWEDFLKPFCKNVKEIWRTGITKALVVLYGLLGVGVASGAEKIGGHVLYASLSFTGATSGPSLGMFILGSMTRTANAKGTVVGCILATAFNMWVALGAFVNRPHRKNLPAANRSCELSTTTYYPFNVTSLYNYSTVPLSFFEAMPEDALYSTQYNTTSTPPQTDDLNKLYSLSFLWYSTIGAGITVTVGLVVSWLTGGMGEDDIEEELLIPLFDRLCCCLPKSVKAKLTRKSSFELTQTAEGHPGSKVSNEVNKDFVDDPEKCNGVSTINIGEADNMHANSNHLLLGDKR